MDIAERLLNHCIPEPNSGCWLGLRTVNKLGYAKVTVNNNRRGAHRIAWQVWRGPIPPGIDVLHKCDVRCCINPDHLFLGTHYDNMHDMMRKGRADFVRGVRHPQAILTEAQVIAIRNDSRPNGHDIAFDYGISESTVRNIKKRRTWRHLP